MDLESFVQAAGDAIIAAKPDGTIILWNPAAARIFGFTAEQALGHSLDLIIPERFRERHWQGFRKVMLTGQTRYGTEVLRVPAVHKSGRSSQSPLRLRCFLRAPDRSTGSPQSFAMKPRAGTKNARSVDG